MTRSPTLRRMAALGTAMALLVTMAVPAAIAKNPKAPVDVQILGLNDFHGQLEAVDPTVTSGARIGSLTSGVCAAACIAAGGVEYLATHVANLKATNPNTVFVSAGDLIGATPLLSALFHDEPTIEAFNLMGLDYNGVGNHEFDEGVDELLRIAYGDESTKGYEPARPDGCHPVDGCGDGDGYGGADFDFLAANVAYKDSGKTIFAPYSIHNFPGGVKVAFVGMTLEGTPLIVSPGGISSVDFLDEAETVNALVPHLQRRGVEAIVVLLHEGGSVNASGNGAGNIGTINSCNQPVRGHSSDRPAPGPGDRHHDHRSHELGGQLQVRRPRRHRCRLAGPADHRHRRPDRSHHEGLRARVDHRQQPHRDAGCGGSGADGPHREVQGLRGADFGRGRRQHDGSHGPNRGDARP